MRILKRLIVHLCGLGWDLVVAWPMVLLVRLLWGEGLRWEEGVLKCAMKLNSFPVTTPFTAEGWWKWWTKWPRGFYLRNRKKAATGEQAPWSWRGSSVGNGQIFGPGRLSPRGELPTRTMVHENHHTIQARAAAISATFWAVTWAIALACLDQYTAAAVMGLAMWILGGNLSISSGGWTHAWLDEHPDGFYQGSAHEVGAYAVGDLWEIERVKPK